METRKMTGSKSIGYLRCENFEERIIEIERKGVKGK